MLTVLDGNSFLVADDHGDVGAGSEGLYYNDTRYLSAWQLLLNGEPPQLLSSDTVDYYSAAVFLQNPPLPGMPAGAVSLIRDVFVGEGSLQNTLRVENHLIEPVELELRLEFDFDFLDLFEVKAREYRDEDLVFTRRTEPGFSVDVSHDEDENSWSFRLRDGVFSAEALVWVSQRGHTGDRFISHSVSLQAGRDLGVARKRGAAVRRQPPPRPLHHLLLRPGAGAGRGVAASVAPARSRAGRPTGRSCATPTRAPWPTWPPCACGPPGQRPDGRPAGRRAAVVHDRVRPRHAADQLPDAAAGPVARRPARWRRWPRCRRASETTSATASPARSCTSCGWAGSRPRAAPSPTTAASTRPCCS